MHYPSRDVRQRRASRLTEPVKQNQIINPARAEPNKNQLSLVAYRRTMHKHHKNGDRSPQSSRQSGWKAAISAAAAVARPIQPLFAGTHGSEA